jgi:glucosamine 6-phosphate synthetase-like amidotransferase/phosphosugar isomerase protein
MIGDAPDRLERDVLGTGAQWVGSALDPVAELIRAQRLAITMAAARGLDPDHPRNLTRSVILDPA